MDHVPDATAAATSLLTFPCQFPLKVMLRNAATIRDQVLHIVAQLDPEFDPLKDCQQRTSRDANYLALSVQVHPKSQAQLDAIYRALHQIEGVKYLL